MVKNLLKSLKTFKIDAECLVYIVFHIKMMLSQRKVLFLHAKKMSTYHIGHYTTISGGMSI